jgi:hypothetical protein
MFTITQAWLDMFPSWYDAGWRVGDQINLCNVLENNENLAPAKNALLNHPPIGPHH